MLTIGTIVFGLLALILPVVYLQDYHKHAALFSMGSFSACAISIGMLLFYHNHLVKIEDWGALRDTSDVVAGASAILIVLTILLNVIVYGKEKSKE